MIYLAQIPGLIFSENKFENIYLIISSLTAILTIILIEEFFSKDEKKFLYTLFLHFIYCFFLNFIPQIKLYIEGQQIFYGGLTKNLKFFGKDTRSSGSSRTCLILIILLFILEKNLFKKKIFFSKSLIVLLLTSILYIKSRTIILQQ